MFYVYILKSKANDRTYVGITSKSVNKRLSEHNLSSNRWTAKNKPFEIIYYESYYCKKDALHRGKFLKSGIGKKLVRLVKEHY